MFWILRTGDHDIPILDMPAQNDLNIALAVFFASSVNMGSLARFLSPCPIGAQPCKGFRLSLFLSHIPSATALSQGRIDGRLPGKTISSEIASEDKLISGLKNHIYQLCILHTDPEDRSLFCQRFMQEQLYISISKDHPLAKAKRVTFDDLRGLRILVNGNVGFWLDICKRNLHVSHLLIQENPDALADLVEASSLPFFNSDQYIARGFQTPGRVSIPINDTETLVTYRLACLASNQKTYRSVFNAVRGNLLGNISVS